MHSFTIVGPGRMGGALAIALRGVGYRIDALIGRNRKFVPKLARYISPRPNAQQLDKAGTITSDIVLITTPDTSIGETAQRLKGLLGSRKQFVFHSSGSLSSSILQPLANQGVRTGSIHPLISVSFPTEGASKLAGAYFCVEGDAEAVRVARRIVRKLGGKPFSIKTEAKPLYHLSAVLAAGHLTALADLAFSLMSETGLNRSQAQTVLLPLIESAIENLRSRDISKALTGPIARGDLAVIDEHLKALFKIASKNESDIYLDLALRSIDIVERGRRDKNLVKLRKMILLAKENTK